MEFLVKNTLVKRLNSCKKPSEVLKIKVIDLACGSGTFLVKAFEEFKRWFDNYERKNKDNPRLKEENRSDQSRLNLTSDSATYDFLDKVLENCIYGIDLDPRAARLARLNLFIRAVNTPKTLPSLNIIEKNSLIFDKNDPNAFILENEFPLISEEGGFDIIIGNPPWEKWKPNSQEFFEPFYPGFKSLDKQDAIKVMDELLKNSKIKRLWEEKLNLYKTYSKFFRENYKYQVEETGAKKTSGDLDLYKLFVERAYSLLKDGGLLGYVVPSGIYTDLGAKGLRKLMFEKCEIDSLFSFENRKAIFKDIHRSYKFVLLTFIKKRGKKSFPCAFFLYSHEDLIKAIKNPTILDIDFIKKSSPTSWSVLEIKTQKDYEIVKKLLRFPRIGKELKNSWNIKISSGFHMTNDSNLFRKDRDGIPLLEGKNIEQFRSKGR